MTVTYDRERDRFGRQFQWLVEIEMDTCGNSYTVPPCLAPDQGDGKRCYYTFATCQDPLNFNRQTKVYRFCLADVPWPDRSVDVFPLLDTFSIVEQRIEPANLATFSETVTIVARYDWKPPPDNQDRLPSLINTGYSGEFWRNFKARHINYPGRPVRLYRGFNAPDFTLADFERVGPEYKLTAIKMTADGVEISAESPIRELSTNKVPFSVSQDNVVVASIDNVTDPIAMPVVNAAECPDPNDYTRFKVYIQIDQEILAVTNRDTALNELTCDRAQLGTPIQTHSVGDQWEHVAYFGSPPNLPYKPDDVLRDLLEWCRIPDSEVNNQSFDDVGTDIWVDNSIQRIVAKPDSVAVHMQTIRELFGLMVYLDRDGKWTCRYLGPHPVQAILDEDSMIEGTTSLLEDEEERITRVTIWYDPTEDNPSNKPRSYDKSVVTIDATLEQPNFFGEDRPKEVFSPWLDSTYQPIQVSLIALRVITRNRLGRRVVAFSIELKDGEFHVGDEVDIKTSLVLDEDGDPQTLPCVIIGRVPQSPNIIRYECIDTGYGGRYLRHSRDDATEPYDDATTEDRAAGGYWGNADDGRIPDEQSPGYIFV